MIFQCPTTPGCGRTWSLYPTGRRVKRAPIKACPDCKADGVREPRSRKRKRVSK